MSSQEVFPEHFRLLEAFGRNRLARSKREDTAFQEDLWKMSCQSAGLPEVTYARALEVWRAFITGGSRESALAMNGDIDPTFVCVGITWKGRLIGAHTLATRTLLRSVLRVWARAHPTPDDFLAEAESLCREVSEEIVSRSSTRTKEKRT